MTSPTTVTIMTPDQSDVLGTGVLVAAQIVQVDPPSDLRLFRSIAFDPDRGGTYPTMIRLQSADPAVDEIIAADQVLVEDGATPALPLYFALSRPSECAPDEGPIGGPCSWFHHPKPFFC